MNKKEKEAVKKLSEAFTKSLDQIYKVCETSAKEFNSKSVPLSLIKLCIDEVKKNFAKGLKG